MGFIRIRLSGVLAFFGWSEFKSGELEVPGFMQGGVEGVCRI